MSDYEPDYRPARERSLLAPLLVLVALLLGGYGGWQWWQQRQAQPPQPAAPSAAPAVAAEPEAATPPAAPEGPQNPVDAIAQPEAELPALDAADARVRAALDELLGAKAVGSFLLTDGFVRRVVATVDNLPREHAPVRQWPARPTPGRFMLSGPAGAQAQSSHPDNAARYTPFVLFAESVPAAPAAALYARLYPLFQQAYEELGYPGRYFNDRLIATLDHLLAAPEPAQPLAIRVVEVRGEVPSEKPWIRYEFADAKLEALSAGQKTMVRMGLENERRMKAVLRAFRAQVATAVPARKAAP